VAKQEFNQVRDAVDKILGVSTVIKRRNKSKVEKKRELFVQTINSMEELLIRSNLLYAEIGVDYSSYDEKFLSVIDSLLFMHFGQQCFELISWYLYERLGPDGTTIGQVSDEDGNPIEINNPYDLYDLILKANPNI
jgi:hypothetical protein